MQRLSRQYNNMKKEAGSRKKEGIALKRLSCLLLFALLLSSFSLLPASLALAQNTQPNEDITSSNFNLVVCDGPDIPKSAGGNPQGYRVCDFNAAMQEVQHLINILIIFGVVVAVGGFCYAGYLYIAHGSEPGARSDANSVFRKVFIGFIIMLTAWFIVYQILSWLQCGPGSTNCNAPGTSLLKNSQ